MLNKKQQKIGITRRVAVQKIGYHSKYAALTALGTYFILHPQSAQADSADTPGVKF
jgi:hypothetical protein